MLYFETLSNSFGTFAKYQLQVLLENITNNRFFKLRLFLIYIDTLIKITIPLKQINYAVSILYVTGVD